LRWSGKPCRLEDGKAADESSEVIHPTSAFRELEFERAASHEAGHAAVSVHLGMRFHPVTIRPSGMYDGSLEPDLSLEDESKAAEIARRQVSDTSEA
jgi:hypothetical protein